MGVKALNAIKYGKLCAAVVPKLIQNDHEFDRMVEILEGLDRKKDATVEERALAELLAKLIEIYDDEHYPLGPANPIESLKFCMDQKGLKQADLAPVIGSRAQVSAIVNGKRGISKAQARKLADFFKVPIDLFIP